MASIADPIAIQYANKCLSVFFNGQYKPLKRIDEFNWTLRQEPGSAQTFDDKGMYIIWPFPIRADLSAALQSISLYISISVSMQRKSKEDIDAVNIKVFKEDITKLKSESGYISTELLLRAEWSNDGDETQGEHAHPHWHIHSYKVIDVIKHLPALKQKALLELISEEEHSLIADALKEPSEIGKTLGATEENTDKIATIKSINHPQEIPSFKFHLAMLAEWDKTSKTKDKKQLTSESLKNWLPKCLFYIQNQIEYALQRMS